jgi:dimethylhistidine N-methyltransferase
MHENTLTQITNSQKQDTLYEVLEGLTRIPKELPCRLLYDEMGSFLFEQICKLDEYYLTRTEMNIMRENIDEITDVIGKNCSLIEFGSGNSKKTRLILDKIKEPASYIPIDISLEYLIKSVKTLAKDYPQLKITPVHADYTQNLDLSFLYSSKSRLVVYYPGSSIGNFNPKEAKRILKSIAKLTGEKGGLLIGIDLKKDKETLESAYNDKKGITALFNLNILKRLNNELHADFDLSNWLHRAFYNSNMGRIEMHLVSLKKQHVHVGSNEFYFKEGETILTEYSYKYTLHEFKELVCEYFTVNNTWIDKEGKFSINFLSTHK